MTGVPLSSKQSTSWMALTPGTRPTATLKLGQNSGCNVTTVGSATILQPPNAGAASVQSLGQFFFYSNNPEQVFDSTKNGGLADNGFWLLKERVTGNGRMFYWHQNATGKSINSELLIYNPSTTTAITVNAIYGLTVAGDGVSAWFTYFGGTATQSVTIPKSTSTTPQFGSLFAQNLSGIPKNAIYGVVADISITDGAGNAMQADLYDLAWIKNAGGATSQAIPDGTSRVRGLGNGFWIPINLNPFIIPTGATPGSFSQGFTVGSVIPPGGANDSFNGADVPQVTDPDPLRGTSALLGNYGSQMCVTWPVTNNDTKNKQSITFYGGNALNLGTLPSGKQAPTNFAINYLGALGGCSFPSPPLTQFEYIPILTDTVLAGTAVTYRFQVVTIGGFTYPLTLLVRNVQTP